MTFSGATLGGRQRSRLSIGARALGTPPDPTQLPRPLHAAPPTPPLLAPHPPSARAGPQPAALPHGSQEAMELPLRGLTVPYTQRLQTAGLQPFAFPNCMHFSADCMCVMRKALLTLSPTHPEHGTSHVRYGWLMIMAAHTP